jgi:N-acetylmuramoyl-L-alanine amidase
MKKYILLIVSLLFITAVGFAQRTDFSGLTIVIDPGHSGYNSNDRQLSLPDLNIPGLPVWQAYFWESYSNWCKALYLDTLLTELGANVLLTREHNNYGDNLPSLSARWQFANANNATWFHSIHSNALNGATNYTLMLVKEIISTRQPAFPEAVTMSDLIGPSIMKHNRTTSTQTRLDYTFYGGPPNGYNLGVLSGTVMPAELSEGSFHDYLPETRRLMNMEYKKSEAYAIRNAFMEYFGVPKDTLGIVAGIVNDVSIGKPVNYVRVILEPLGLVYNGDFFNNGYYFFDKLQAGDYTVIFETEGYGKQSLPVTVTRGDIKFVDIRTSNITPATITQSSVRDGDSTISATANFDFTFSKIMDRTSVQNSISFEPPVTCRFTWSNSDMTVRVSPSTPMQSNTNYIIKIDGSAKDAGGTEMGQPFIRNFKTLPADQENPVVFTTYPLQTPVTRGFNPLGTVTITFNKLMDTASLRNAISLRRSSTNRPMLLWFYNFDEKTIVTLKPVEPLDLNAQYIVYITTDAKDIAQNPLRAQYNLPFYTAEKNYTATILESFSGGIGGWWAPGGSGSTAGVNIEKTITSVETNIYYPFTNNNRSMKLNYSFLPNTTNLIRVHLASGNAYSTLINTISSKKIASFVFGDGSKNRVRFCVYDNPSGANAAKASSWVTMDWHGWRLIEWNFTDPNEISSFVSNDPILGPLVRFEGYHVQHDIADEFNLEGAIYFDELMVTDEATTSVPELPSSIPSKFSLEQNYPNPFNPSTNLQLNINDKAKVKLVIYDLLGREVYVLKDEIMEPGNYTITWNATGLPSGVYFAKLYSGANISTIKMILSK